MVRLYKIEIIHNKKRENTSLEQNIQRTEKCNAKKWIFKYGKQALIKRQITKEENKTKTPYTK